MTFASKLIVTCLSLCFSSTAMAEDHSIAERCALLSEDHIADFKTRGENYTLIEIDSFYSKKVDSCIHIEKKLVGVGVEIRDLSRSIILLEATKNHNVLLNCDIDGADSAILDIVRAYRGAVAEVPHREWLDDGFGGPPRTLKTPDKPYTKEQCHLVLDKWLSILR